MPGTTSSLRLSPSEKTKRRSCPIDLHCTMEAAKPTENKTDAMNDSTIAFKAHKQLKRFLGRFSPHFHKPTVQFIGQALYGIQASGDVKLASWVRMLDEGISAKKVEDRLSRNLSLEGMDRKIQQIVMDDSRGFVKKDTLIVIDPADICKENARKMQYLYKVRDGSRSEAQSRQLERHLGLRDADRAGHDEPPCDRPLRLARQGDKGPDPVRSDPRRAARHPGCPTPSRRREGIRNPSDDPADVARQGEHLQVALANRRRIPEPVARRGHDPIHQAGASRTSAS